MSDPDPETYRAESVPGAHDCCAVELLARAFLAGTRSLSAQEVTLIAGFFLALHTVTHAKKEAVSA